MKKIDRYRIYMDDELDENGNVERIYQCIQEHECGDWCKAGEVDKLENTVEELVELLINSTIDCINTNYAEISPRWLLSKSRDEVLKMAERMESKNIKYLEIILGKPWIQIREDKTNE